MSDTRIDFVQSPDMGKTIRERLEVTYDTEEQYARYEGYFLVKDLEAACDDNREQESLRSLTARRTVGSLSADLQDFGMTKASLRGKKKAELVDLVMNKLMPSDLEDFILHALPLGSE